MIVQGHSSRRGVNALVAYMTGDKEETGNSQACCPRLCRSFIPFINQSNYLKWRQRLVASACRMS